MHTKIIDSFDLKEIQIDVFKSADVRSGDALGGAVAGGLLFGGVGAIVGAVANSSKKPVWIVEIVAGNQVQLFKLQNDSDKNALTKYIKKHV